MTAGQQLAADIRRCQDAERIWLAETVRGWRLEDARRHKTAAPVRHRRSGERRPGASHTPSRTASRDGPGDDEPHIGSGAAYPVGHQAAAFGGGAGG